MSFYHNRSFATPSAELTEELVSAQATVEELEYFQKVLAQRINSEIDPTVRACWRAHERATIAEICRIRRMIAELSAVLSSL